MVSPKIPMNLLGNDGKDDVDKTRKIDSMGMWDISMPLYLFHRLRRLLNTPQGVRYHTLSVKQ